MRNILISAGIVLTSMIASGAALAGPSIAVPEPVSMSLLAGGVVAIAAVRHLRRK
jgi:hypothetical protein